MLKTVLLCYVTVIWCASRTSSNPTAPQHTYNSSDLSYLSNGIQFPVDDVEMQALVQQTDNEEISQNQWFSRLYDHYAWWSNLRKMEDSPCKEDMAIYLAELDNGTSWAVKMFDASGRYSGQFYFGNDFWLGSKTLCEELGDVENNKEVPPYKVQFYVAKIRINLNKVATPVTRQLNLGECLPKSCGPAGVRTLLAQERNQAASVNIAGVRTVPGDYSLLADYKVHLVGGYGLVVVLLVVAASAVEFFNDRRSGGGEIYSSPEDNNNSKYSSNKDSLNASSEISLSCSKSEPKKHDGIPLRLLLSFSAIANGKKIISVEKPSLESIQCIHGLRFFSISWIILVHSYLEVFAISDNKNYRIVTERSFTYQTISNATFSVDTFFFISGLLVTLTYFRTEHPKHQAAQGQQTACTCLRTTVTKFLMMVVYRFFRLTPPYLFVLGVNEIVMRYLHANSVFSPAIIDHISCGKFWWRNVLYINNFYPQHEFCMLWSWYIANDTQFYVIASFLLVFAVRGPRHVKFVSAAVLALMAASWTATFLIALKYEYAARVEQPFALFDQLYDKPWLRIGPYLVGMMTGYALFKRQGGGGGGGAMKPPAVALGWALALLCLGCLVYGLGRDGLVVPASAFYAALGHSAWGLALAWIAWACSAGRGGPVNALLSCELFLPLSRLTYCAYLIHPVLMCLTSFYLDGPMHLHRVMAIVVFCGNLVLSFFSAFLISLAFEAPVVNLLKIIFT